MQRFTRTVALLAVAVALAAGLLPWSGAARPAEAGGSWSAWLYNPETGRLVHAFPDGAAPVEMPFPLPPDTSRYPSLNQVAISPDGSLLAMCLYNDSDEFSVRVYDIYNEVYIAAYIPGGPVMECGLTPQSFSEDGSQVAVGIFNHYPGDGDPRPQWELVVMQMHTSAILHRIDSSSPAITALGADVDGAVPFVRSFQMATPSFPGVLAFIPVRWGTEGFREYPSIVWQLSDGSVSINGPYGKTSLGLLPNPSEAVWVEEDDAFPKGELMGPGYLFNIVMYSNKAGDRYPIYSGAGQILGASVFIDNGRRLAIRTFDGMSSAEQWWVLARGGEYSALPIPARVYQVWGTVDGYAFVASSGEPGVTPELRYHRFTGGPAPEQYVAWSGTPGEYWSIIWANPLEGEAGLPPFSPLTIIGPPPVMTDTPAPVTPPGAVLAPGGTARVQTTAGDMLRVRTGPGLSFAIATQLTNGTLVSVLEGPVSADGLSWWRIDAPGRGSGWAVEGVMDGASYLQTLVPQ